MIEFSTPCVSYVGCNHAHASAHPEHTVQEQYETLCKKLFDALDKLEKRVDGQRYLIPSYPGGRATPCPTLADYRLFATLIRFDIAYYPLFKTNLRHIRDYPNLQVSFCANVCAHLLTEGLSFASHGCFKVHCIELQVLLAAATAVCRLLAKLWQTSLGNNQPFIHTTEVNNIHVGQLPFPPSLVVGQQVHVPASHPTSQWALLTEQAYGTRRLHAQSSHAGHQITAITMQLKLLLSMHDSKVFVSKLVSLQEHQKSAKKQSD